MASQSAQNPWIFAGLASSFPNIEPDSSTTKKTKIANTAVGDGPEPNPDTPPPPCKILQLSSPASPQPLTPEEAQLSIGLEPQILIFRYRNKLHAIDHSCPHRSYPLSRGSIYDIEDFGIVLSAGIACPKHGWTFDLFTGESDRGGYKLGIWEIETREDGSGEEEVWVRKTVRKRIG